MCNNKKRVGGQFFRGPKFVLCLRGSTKEEKKKKTRKEKRYIMREAKKILWWVGGQWSVTIECCNTVDSYICSLHYSVHCTVYSVQWTVLCASVQECIAVLSVCV